MTPPDTQFLVRESKACEQARVEAIYPLAFPDEDLVPLLRDLWREPEHILSLVAERDDVLVAHAIFTRCSLSPEPASLALLGPIAVQPDQQGRGAGSALILEGFRRLREEGAAMVCVLGDPAYYSRFGFEASRSVEPPYSASDLPGEWEGAWQSIVLAVTGAGLRGRLLVPAAWDHESLWLP